MQRFYTPDRDLGAGVLVIDDIDLVHQMSKVMRMREGDVCILFSGNKIDYEYRVDDIQKRSLTLSYVGEKENPYDPLLSLTVYQSLPNKWEKSEFIVQKTTEIGVSHIVFFPSDRSQVHDIPDKKLERLHKIAIEASEQSGRPTPPTIETLSSFPEISEDSIVLDFGGRSTPEIVAGMTSKEVSIFIGPEGGWSDTERKLFKEKKCTLWSLGDSVLRLETACICSSFCLLQFGSKNNLAS